MGCKGIGHFSVSYDLYIGSDMSECTGRTMEMQAAMRVGYLWIGEQEGFECC